MALNIKDERTDRLARELAALTGQPLTAAVREALEQRLAAVRRRALASSGPDLSEIITRGRARATLDDRSEAAILGYGDAGLPG